MDLEPHQIHAFYESVGHMIQAESDPQKRDEYLQRLMQFPNQRWTKIICQARQSGEMKGLGHLDQKLAMAKRCDHEGLVAGARAAVVATVASAVPMLASMRMLPWAKRNNPMAQALIVSLVAGSAFFIVVDKSVLTTARRNSFQHLHF